ncbi:hypothetical protein ALC53_05730 [Atta colombica]|uniref:Uncharacterized protein n=1 Tax=Atta colombica TaxID=520822 RepID=A0A195BI12_9HYME|nr:hypothetical protein ALC53_05730 [Atta colombica]
MRVTCHRARAVTRRHPRGMAATQAKRFTLSVAGVASAPHFPPDVSPISSDGQVPYGLEMDRLATRIYCGVAAFEREHALNCEKKEYKVPVADSNDISYTFRGKECRAVHASRTTGKILLFGTPSGVPFREFRKTQEAIIPRRKNILLGHTEENSLAHNFSANKGNLEALDISRLTYEGCSAAKLMKKQQTFVDSTTFYGKSSRTKSNPAPVPIRLEGPRPAEGKAKIGPIYYMENRFNRRLSIYPCGRDRSRYRNDISWPVFAAADGGNMRIARWRDKKVG